MVWMLCEIESLDFYLHYSAFSDEVLREDL